MHMLYSCFLQLLGLWCCSIGLMHRCPSWMSEMGSFVSAFRWKVGRWRGSKRPVPDADFWEQLTCELEVPLLPIVQATPLSTNTRRWFRHILHHET